MFRVFTYFRSFVCSYFLSFLSLFPFAHSTCHDSSFREYHGSIDVFASRRGYELQSDIHKYRWQNNTHVFHEHIFFYISSVFFRLFVSLLNITSFVRQHLLSWTVTLDCRWFVSFTTVDTVEKCINRIFKKHIKSNSFVGIQQWINIIYKSKQNERRWSTIRYEEKKNLLKRTKGLNISHCTKFSTHQELWLGFHIKQTHRYTWTVTLLTFMRKMMGRWWIVPCILIYFNISFRSTEWNIHASASDDWLRIKVRHSHHAISNLMKCT